MAETRKLRFMVPRGYGGVVIARGALIEVAEPWASRFIADGTAVEAKAAKEPKAETTPAEKKPTKKKTK